MEVVSEIIKLFFSNGKSSSQQADLNKPKGSIPLFLYDIHKERSSYISKLPQEILMEISHFAFADEVKQLFEHIKWGEQEQAEMLLKKDPQIGLMYGEYNDLVDRKFKDISPFQAALWSLDWHMWEMMLLKCFKEAKNSKELFTEALKQYDAFMTGNLPWQKHHGKHFDFGPLIAAYHAYIEDIYNCDKWQKGVGGEQRKCPAHVLQAYCDPNHIICPTSTFKEDLLRRGKMFEAADKDPVRWIYEGGMFNGGVLGTSFCLMTELFEGAHALNLPAASVNGWSFAGDDFDAIKLLSKIRYSQLYELRTVLSASAKQNPDFGFNS